MRSANHGHTETVKLLVKNGANVHANNDEAFLMSACGGHRHAEIVKILSLADTTNCVF